MFKFKKTLVALLSCALLSSCSFNFGGNNDESGDNNETGDVTTEKFSVTFINYDNSLLYQTEVEKGSPAFYQGKTPERAESDTYIYEFAGWDKDLTSIQSDVVTIAEYESIRKTPNEEGEEVRGLTRSQKIAYYEGTNQEGSNSYDTPYGIGRAVNALTDKYIEITNRYNPIFDINQLVNLSWTKTKLRQQEAQVISEDSASKFQESLSISYGNKSSAQVGVTGIFTAGLDSDFGISNDLHINKNTHEIVSKLYQNINSFTIEIEGYNDYRTFRPMLSSKILEDIKNVEEGKLSTDEFFQFYGTHVVMAGYYGGRIECNYHLMFDSSEVTDTTMATYKTKASAGLKKAQVSASASRETNFSIKNEIGITEEAKAETFTFKGRGGKYISGATEADFMKNYASWVDSFNSDEENFSVLVDVPDKALMPIWNLFPEEYSKATNIILNAFQMKADQCKNDWLSKCSYIYDEKIINDEINFAGGAGTKDNPYLISNQDHLLKIEKYMNSYFELTNDISIAGITNWEPIGGKYLENEFNGQLDGKGHSIIGMKRTSGVPEKSNRSYFGFFGNIGKNGVVKDITFDGVNVKITGPANNNGSMRAFFAVVAGKCTGSMSNVILKGSFVYSCCTNGETWMGGLAGYAVGATFSHCENYIPLKTDRYATSVGGFVGYSESGKIEYCTNDANIKAVGTDWGGFARASLVGGTCHKTNPTLLVDLILKGSVTAAAYDNSSLFTSCATHKSTIDFAYKADAKY